MQPSPQSTVRRETLTDLVLDGLGHARLHFGIGDAPVTGHELLAAGRRAFAASAAGDTFAMLMTNDAATVAVLLGALAAGVRMVSLPLPARTADVAGYVAFVRTACESQGAHEIVARDDVADLLAAAGLTVRRHSDLGPAPLAAPSGGGFELIQFSSGSTAHPKAVKLTDASLGANVAAIMERLEPEPGDHSVSWLPLSHDMGLIGMLFTSLASTSPQFVGSADIVVLDPTTFLRNPGAWLGAISEFRATITAAPDFGYRLSLQRASDASLDLSRLRCAIVGGEIVRASTLRAFAERFAVRGFRSEAFCPAYGLAEIGLAATMTPVDEQWRPRVVASLELARRRWVPAGETNEDVSSVVMVSSGPPIPGYRIRSEGDTGVIGTISVQGPSIGADALTGASFAGPDGWLATGDVGVVMDGWLYVSGRGDDHIVTNSRNVYAPAIEDAVGAVHGIRAGRTAVIGLPSGDWIVVAEPESTEPLSARERSVLTQEVKKAATIAAASRPSDIAIIPRGRLPLTPSGKLQRHETIRRYLVGDL